jgi:hypothetical protein
MDFKKDIFISYAHLDNQPLSEKEQGWVSRFHSLLETMLTTRIGEKAIVWRDEKKLSGNDFFAEVIVKQFPQTAVLVSVLTPSYAKSAWCLRELKEFCRAAEESGGLMLDDKARLIKVIKTPPDSEDPLPPVMQQMLGYEFFTRVNEAPLELDPDFPPEMARQYTVKLAVLCFDIAKLLKKLRGLGNGGKPPTEPASSKPCIYMAECSYDRREAREALETELRLHGYRLLPESKLPRDESAYVAEVSKLMKECKLSIHMVGTSYGAVPDGPSGKSVVVLQNEQAILQGAEGNLKRFIWLPEGTTSSNSDQSSFIQALQRDPQVQAGADLITADFETFKTAIHSVLRQLEAPQPEPNTASPASGRKLAYVICTEKDRSATIPLRRHLRSRGLDAEIPLFVGEAAVVRQANQELLTQADGVIVFYGAGDEAWRRTVESDLKKANAYRGDKPPCSIFTYLAADSTLDKEDRVELKDPNVINALAGFDETQLEPFLRSIHCWQSEAAAGGAGAK